MATVTIQEANENFTQLFDAAVRGEEVVIERDGVVARLIVEDPNPPAPPLRRLGMRGEGVVIHDPNWDAPMGIAEIRLGIFDGQAVIHDPDWDAPLSNEELREMLGDEYVDAMTLAD